MRREARWVAMAAGLVTAAFNARAADVSADLPVLSGYVWRWQVLNDEPVVQPALNVVNGGFAVNAWGNFNTTDKVTGDADFSEIDLTVSYGGRIGAVGYGVGLIEYLFPNTTYSGTREAYVSVSLPDLFVVPSLSVYRDLDEADGFYASFGLSKTMAVADKTSLCLSASVGAGDEDYNAFYFGVEEAALNDVNVCASVAYAMTDKITVTPCLQYTWLPDSDIRDGAREVYLDDEQVVGGVKLSVIF
jgi:hypothetical protein